MTNITKKRMYVFVFQKQLNMIFCSEQRGKRVFEIKIWHFKDSTCIQSALIFN